MAKSKTPDPTCSFCGLSTREAGNLLAGPNDVFICQSCSKLSQDMFQKSGKGGMPDAAPVAAPAVKKDKPLAPLKAARDL
jgi:ATP-dependent protease Clp ATPase subunit